MIYPMDSSSIVTNQPKQYDIHSNFAMFPGERLLYHTQIQKGYCDLGDRHYTSITDIRYIARREEFICCSCCCTPSYQDTSIYLKDISQIREERNDNGCCEYWYKYCCGCLWCCRLMVSKRFRLYGSFGRHTVHIDEKDRKDFELIIAEAIAQHKR